MNASFIIKRCTVLTIWLPKFAFISLAIGQKADSEKHTHIYAFPTQKSSSSLPS